ncbi:hypothetical protein [Corynebacterium lipophiloflavum]|uniref:Uncharacterized protein n=1 Tax=Corynebacterium lipophiloflavum (strain ATCC 700352 / DSM 44291 / CCUG 37336 / JCM 10383 / DMMZ 1944) TaxID=525263 RepID=C0XTU0_CORLD|nr:hypothetical protein HMPREF0298_1860 [Corynebacterium lipophiloflavum DSM 44291]
MANSDNVLRGGLTEKHIDTDELFSVLRFEALDRPTLRSEGSQYQVPVNDFRVEQITDTAGPSHVKGPAIVLNASGTLRVGDVTLGAGEAAWVPACEGDVAVAGERASGFVVTTARSADAG